MESKKRKEPPPAPRKKRLRKAIKPTGRVKRKLNFDEENTTEARVKRQKIVKEMEFQKNKNKTENKKVDSDEKSEEKRDNETVESNVNKSNDSKSAD